MRINVKNLRLSPILGAYDWERNIKHHIIVNIRFDCDTEKAAKSDVLEDTVNYDHLVNKIYDSVPKTNFMLIERLCGFILDIVMDFDKRITYAEVEIDKWAPPNDKPGAMAFLDSVSITHSRKR